jgi:hypothetical protein
MMRAWAAISAAAVLVALPTTVDRAAADVLDPDGSTPVAAVVDPLAAGHLGVWLWLSVAMIAVIVAVVVLRRSRARIVADPAPAVGGTSAELRSVTATAGR